MVGRAALGFLLTAALPIIAPTSRALFPKPL